MARPLFGLLLWLVSASRLWAIDFNHYHSQEEINTYLHDVARAHPLLVHCKFLGYSQGGREIDYAVISHGDPESLPAIYLNGTHHGDEKSSTETVLGLIDFLVRNDRMQDVNVLLNNYAVYLQPLVNPDGHALNTRYDANGRDPNRDYSFPGRADEESFKVPAIKLVKELADKIHPRAAVAFHSGMEGVLWAWAYSGRKAADTDTFYTLSKLTAQAMRMPRYVQSFDDYPSNGEFIDYLYMTQGTLALTVEVSNDPAPPAPQLAAVVRRAVAGGMSFMLGVLELDRGELKLERASDAPPSSRPLLTARDGTLLAPRLAN